MVILLTKDYKDKQADTRLAAVYKTRVALRQYKSTRVALTIQVLPLSWRAPSRSRCPSSGDPHDGGAATSETMSQQLQPMMFNDPRSSVPPVLNDR